LPQVPDFTLAITDLRDAPPAEAEEAAQAVRARLEAQVLDPGRWPLFEMHALRFEGSTRLCISLDALMCDARSLGILTREMSALYHDPQAVLAPLAVSF